MNLENQISVCSTHYQKWKTLAFSATNPREARKCMERAFFWIELQAAFIILFSIEQAKGKDPDIKRQLKIAKANLSKRLADYANEILNEID